MNGRRFSPRSTQGFTMLEMLVVVIIIGILFAIAAPAWLSFLNTQRLNTAQNQVLDILRQTQSTAKLKHLEYDLSLRQQNSQVQWAMHPSDSETTTLNWNNLDQGIKLLKSETTFYEKDGIYRVRFSHYGDVKGQLGRVTLTPASGGGSKRCVIVSSLLGAMRTGENQPTRSGNPCD